MKRFKKLAIQNVCELIKLFKFIIILIKFKKIIYINNEQEIFYF